MLNLRNGFHPKKPNPKLSLTQLKQNYLAPSYHLLFSTFFRVFNLMKRCFHPLIFSIINLLQNDERFIETSSKTSPIFVLKHMPLSPLQSVYFVQPNKLPVANHHDRLKYLFG